MRVDSLHGVCKRPLQPTPLFEAYTAAYTACVGGLHCLHSLHGVLFEAYTVRVDSLQGGCKRPQQPTPLFEVYTAAYAACVDGLHSLHGVHLKPTRCV